MFSRCRLTMMISLYVFPFLVSCHLCIRPVYFGVPFIFNKTDYYLKKKKKKKNSSIYLLW